MKQPQNSHKYDDILHLPRHISSKHAPMSRYDRAAQFSPFAALTGYDGVIQEAGRLTDTASQLDEGGMALLDEKLRQICLRLAETPRVTVTYFQEDSRKAGGAYLSATGRVKKIDSYGQNLVFTDGTAIPIGRIYELDLLE